MNDEQLEEFSALESIYPDIITKQSENCFDVMITQDLSQECNNGVKLNVLFTEAYPNEPPIISLKPLGDLPVFCIEELKTIVNDSISRSMNSPMTFDIIEAIREYLEKIYAEEEEKPVEIFKKVYETYTPVTLETFLSWKKSYDDEQKEIERKRLETLKNEPFINGLLYSEVWSKPTGRQLFEAGFDVEEVKEDEVDLVS